MSTLNLGALCSKTEQESVLHKLMADGMSASGIPEKLKRELICQAVWKTFDKFSKNIAHTALYEVIHYEYCICI